MIKVIDAHCGAGKTSWVINYINNNPERQYIYCSPLLTELERVVSNTKVEFVQPDFHGHSKTEHFNELLLDHKNIALSHSCFANANEDTLFYLKQNDYVLILDETLNLLDKVAGTPRQHKSDISLLKDNGLIEIDDYGYVNWIGGKYTDSKYYEYEQLAKHHNLICIDDKIMYWQFPVEIFKEMKDIFVMTYQFAGSIMDCYFRYHDLDYSIVSVEKVDDTYTLIDYTPDIEWIHKQRELINICNHEKLNNYKGSDLSKNWFRNKKLYIPQLKRNIMNYLKAIEGAKCIDVMWTTFKDNRKNLANPGYNVAIPITKEERETLSPTELEKLETKNSCFVACNCRATNDYSERSVLAYALNLNINPDYGHYFKLKNIEIDNDMFSLSSMLQWIYRSRIRKGEPIDIYIPSKRMRDLLEKWLNC